VFFSYLHVFSPPLTQIIRSYFSNLVQINFAEILTREYFASKRLSSKIFKITVDECEYQEQTKKIFVSQLAGSRSPQKSENCN
jgi:hypothetical protein